MRKTLAFFILCPVSTFKTRYLLLAAVKLMNPDKKCKLTKQSFQPKCYHQINSLQTTLYVSLKITT